MQCEQGNRAYEAHMRHECGVETEIPKCTRSLLGENVQQTTTTLSSSSIQPDIFMAFYSILCIHIFVPHGALFPLKFIVKTEIFIR